MPIEPRPCAYSRKHVGHQLGSQRCPACVRDDKIAAALLTRIDKGDCLKPFPNRMTFADSLRPKDDYFIGLSVGQRGSRGGDLD